MAGEARSPDQAAGRSAGVRRKTGAETGRRSGCTRLRPEGGAAPPEPRGRKRRGCGSEFDGGSMPRGSRRRRERGDGGGVHVRQERSSFLSSSPRNSTPRIGRGIHFTSSIVLTAIAFGVRRSAAPRLRGNGRPSGGDPLHQGDSGEGKVRSRALAGQNAFLYVSGEGSAPRTAHHPRPPEPLRL